LQSVTGKSWAIGELIAVCLLCDVKKVWNGSFSSSVGVSAQVENCLDDGDPDRLSEPVAHR
jgi:hypothetical protein